MSNNEWVQEGTPREPDWTQEEDDYGVPVEQWDDYSAEQAVPVPTPPAPQPDAEPDQVAGDQPADADSVAPLVDEAVAPLVDEAEAPVVDEAEAPVVDEAEAPLFEEQAVQETAADVSAEERPRPAVIDDAVVPVPADEAPAQEAPDAFAAEERDPIADDAPSYDAPDPFAAPVSEERDPFAAPVSEERNPFAASVAEEPVADDDATRVRPAVVDDAAPGDELAADLPADDAPVAEPLVPVVVDERGDEDPGPVDEPVAHEADAVVAVDEDTDAVEDDADLDDDATDVIEDDDEPGAFGRPADPDATAAIPVAAAGAGAAGIAGLYRSRDADETQVIDTAGRPTLEEEAAEEQRRAELLRQEKEARDQRLGLVATSEANAVRDAGPVRRRGVGGFGSFGLLVLRLIVAGILGVAAYQILGDVDATTTFLSRQSLIPEPRTVAWILGFTLAAMAVLLVIGLAVRVVGVLLTVIAVAALVLLRWGQFNIFQPGMEGFFGDKDLLLAGIGILLLSLGGGKVGIDGAFSAARANAREAKRY